MRMHLLSLISTGGITHRGDIDAFFSATFLAMDYPKDELNDKIRLILKWLETERFIFRKGVDENWIDRSKKIETEHEDWDDSKPSWLMAAESIDGLNYLDQGREVKSKSKSNFGLGFSPATSITEGHTIHVTHDDDPATDEATRMGEVISRDVSWIPMSASIIRTGLRRAVRRIVRNSSEVRDFSFCISCAQLQILYPYFRKQKT